MKLWRMDDHKIHCEPLREFFGNSSSVHCVAIVTSFGDQSPIPSDSQLKNLAYIASGSEDGAVHVWRVSDQQLLYRHQASPERM